MSKDPHFKTMIALTVIMLVFFFLAVICGTPGGICDVKSF